jgi:hypothetical protein
MMRDMVIAFLPILVWLMVGVLLHVRGRMGVGESLLAGALVCAGWVVASTEVLSFFGAITFDAILLAWVVPGAVLGWLLYRERGAVEAIRFGRVRLTAPQKLVVAGICLCLGVAWLQACLTAPATGDAMAYHLQRQVFWMQHHDVGHYSTSVLRQLAMPPLAEYAGLHLMVLTGDDAAHNFLQWVALALCAVAAALITRKYAGGAVTAQLLAALAVVTIPMAFIQGSNTKNDDVLALWTLTGLYYTLRLGDAEWAWGNVVFAGLSFGAMLMTKGTALLFGLPVAVLAVVVLVRRHRGRMSGALGVMAGIVLVMNASAYGRNWRSFGTPFPSDPSIHGGDTLINQDHSAGALVSNVVRNVAPHLVLPWQGWNDGLTAVVGAIHGWLGRDVNDPRTTYEHGRYFFPYAFAQQAEDAAAAPLQMLFVLLLPGLIYWARRELPVKMIGILLAIAAADFVLFCVLLKCQLWGPRLLVPVLVILAPVTGWVLGTARLRYFAVFWAVLLVIGLAPTMNLWERPLWGKRTIFTMTREETRFVEAPEAAVPVLSEAAGIVAIHPRTIGFLTGWSSVDYTFQRLLLNHMKTPPRFSAFNPVFRVTGERDGDPDIVLATERRERLRNEETGTIYRPVAYGPYVVYMKESAIRAAGR